MKNSPVQKFLSKKFYLKFLFKLLGLKKPKSQYIKNVLLNLDLTKIFHLKQKIPCLWLRFYKWLPIAKTI